VGIFFEDISYAADGGLYAELVQNRDFEYNNRDRGGWEATTAWHSNAPIRIASDHPLSKNNPHHAIVTADSLWNEGWDGIAVETGKQYDFSMFVKGKKSFVVQLLAADGTVIAKAKLKNKADDWTLITTALKAKQSEPKARLLLLPQGKEEARIDMVSLFPQETFMGRKNGLRKDLAETIARLKPKFVRFPGGCMSHGQGLDNIYHWQHTVGPLWDRKPDMNIWHYHQTRGLGFYEYFQFCEDIGAEPLPVLAAGVPCQNSANNAQGLGGQQGGIPMADMPAYIEELCNLIEWANGDPATNKWAKMRADAGHPAPFNLKYLGIGNEDIISTVFEERYEMICRAIRTRYPYINICGTVGPFHTPSADYIEGWDFTRKHPTLQYMTDEHYYESTGWFMHHRNYYDGYPRTLANGQPSPKVYLGEWAASTKTKRPNVETALAEALYLTDVERNGDIVEMTSYAPMLSKDGHSNWNPDMIYFSNTNIRTTPAYEVQRMFSVYGGDTYVKGQFTIDNSLQAKRASSSAQLKHRIGASVVRDSKTGKTYVKLVNALPASLELTVDGLTIPETAKTEGFEGKPEDQHFDIKTGEAGQNIVLPPYSFRVIEL
jgi:alpha-L-arabinofuranosidase